MKVNMKLTKTSIVLSLLTLSSANFAFAEATAKGKVAELGLHRLERLVTLKKIEATFQTKSISLSVESLVAPNPAVDPSFKVSIAQGKATDGTQKTLNLLADQTGKVLSFNVAGTLEPVAPPKFTILDAVGLLEVGLHCVQGEAVDTSDLCSKIPELPQFDQNFTVATLSEVVDSTGKLIGAKIDLKAAEMKATIHLTLDGKLDGANPIQIIPTP